MSKFIFLIFFSLKVPEQCTQGHVSIFIINWDLFSMKRYLLRFRRHLFYFSGRISLLLKTWEYLEFWKLFAILQKTIEQNNIFFWVNVI